MLNVAYIGQDDTNYFGGAELLVKRFKTATLDRINWVDSIDEADVLYVLSKDNVQKIKGKKPIVLHFVDDLRAIQNMNEFKQICENINKIIVVNNHTELNLKKSGIAENKITCIENAVPEYFSPGRSDPSLRLDERPVILYCGHVSRTKGSDLLMKATEQIDCVVWLLCGSQIDYVKDNKYYYWQKRDDVVKFYRSADVFVFPSLSEGMSLALLEAMACGLPCITSNIYANKETVRNAGITCRPKAVELQKSIMTVLQSHEMRKKMSEDSLSVATTRKYNTWCDDVISVLREVAT